MARFGGILLRQKHSLRRKLWRAGWRVGTPEQKDVLPGGGVFKRTGGAKRAKPIKTGFFAFWKRDK